MNSDEATQLVRTEEKMRGAAVRIIVTSSYTKREEYADEVKRSTFCLNPKGVTPSSKRFYESFVASCIPVVLADDFVPPFQHHIPWDRLIIVHPENDIKSLLPRLFAIPHKDIARMQNEVQNYWKGVTFQSPPEPDDAFHLAMEEVVLKLPHISSVINRHRSVWAAPES
mmetsp:Transcript_47454/g.119533  ORF Transcript_47454/g.119533 Transcript_47454/m.119533 type:complete len:169 (+) Transcript_47454:1-507(+)